MPLHRETPEACKLFTLCLAGALHKNFCIVPSAKQHTRRLRSPAFVLTLL